MRFIDLIKISLKIIVNIEILFQEARQVCYVKMEQLNLSKN